MRTRFPVSLLAQTVFGNSSRSWRKARQPKNVCRPRRPLSRAAGLFWTFFWIAFGLNFAFGGHGFRDTVLGFIHGVGRFFSGFFSSGGGMVQ